MKKRLPTAQELQKTWSKLQEIHQEYLAVHGVHIPKVDHYSENNKAAWLSILWFYKEEEVHKDDVSVIVQRDITGAAKDQQVRHLKRDGWEINAKKRGCHKLDPFHPSREFLNKSARKTAQLKAGSFDEIKKSFGYRCATCGATEGQPDPRYGRDKVKLQQGHRNPDEAGDDPLNIIPQCQFCNQTYRNDFIFDEKGRAHAVANEKPVQRATKNVQRRIFKWLGKVLDKNTILM